MDSCHSPSRSTLSFQFVLHMGQFIRKRRQAPLYGRHLLVLVPVRVCSTLHWCANQWSGGASFHEQCTLQSGESITVVSMKNLFSTRNSRSRYTGSRYHDDMMQFGYSFVLYIYASPVTHVNKINGLPSRPDIHVLITMALPLLQVSPIYRSTAMLRLPWHLDKSADPSPCNLLVLLLADHRASRS